MPGFILHAGAQVMCAHGGQATPMAVSPRVTVSGQPITTMTSTYGVAGCALPPPPNGNGPCVTAQWIVAATRVLADGQPVLLFDSQAICAPTGTPVMVVASQTRATAM